MEEWYLKKGSLAIKKYEKRTEIEAKQADEKIKHCLTCQRCFMTIILKGKRLGIEHFSNFPTYGKQKEECETCQIRRKLKNLNAK